MTCLDMNDETGCEIRAELRERYLRFMANISGKEAKLNMFEKTSVSGTFVAMQADGGHYIVDNLATPIGVHKSAVLRTKDTVYLSVNMNDLK
ncbi:unnamed protein product [Auanema sp. JU1783]|nr:unnamed protein product [Auanema sp. JU1783]